MARPLRIEFPCAIYHVTSRGDRREPIVLDDSDREDLLSVLGLGCQGVRKNCDPSGVVKKRQD